VTKEESWATVVAATTRHFGKLDILVNNAGISGSAEQGFYSTEAWHRIMAVNATGVFFGIKNAIPAMVANGGGSIVNCPRSPASSVASTFTSPIMPQKLR
jgi:NAD(P)-dependent dehydrogenase (short-subunit alcohol dehydrogenase family)